MPDSPLARRISLRRGSVSASDPYGAHSDINFSPSRSTSTKLTIVRVNDQHAKHDPESHSRPSSPLSFQGRRNHRRHGSNSSTGSATSESSRLSFAFSTFGSANAGGRPSSPTASRQQPGSPGSPSAHRRGGSFSKPRLAPEQVIELARSSTNPKLPSVNGGAVSHAPLAPSLSAPNFTPLPDNVYLPYVDRPSEVATLITTAPTAKLFTLLSQTFPHASRQSCSTPVTAPDFIDTDPKQWNYTQLEYFLKYVDRDLASDEDWARKARMCILSHSELIWERIKGALGIPPELDMPEEDEYHHSRDGNESDMEMLTTKFGEDLEATPSLDNPGSSPLEMALSGSLPNNSPPQSPTISIEPVFAVDPNATIPGDAPGLGDITEDTEEESENLDDVTAYPSPSSPNMEDTVHGLRIFTSASSPNIMAYSSPAFSAASPMISPAISSVSREVNPEAKLKRSNSSSSSLHPESPAMSNLSSYFSYHDIGGEDPYHAAAERGPGNPLFPSNFAHLALGPTLKANNPQLRRPIHVPPPAFSNPHAIRSGMGRRRGVPSWVGSSWDGKLSEYAITTASGSSVVGEA